MAPQKNKNKQVITEDQPECSNKRRRVEILNRTNGVPFTNPFTQFPSIHMLQQHRNSPRNTTTTVFGTDLNLYPSSSQLYQQEEEGEEDKFISSLIPQQNFIINYHINQMLQSVEEFWRRNLSEELKKKKEMEIMLKEKERQAELFKQMYLFYEERAFRFEEMLHRRAGEGCSNVAAVVHHHHHHQDEEVQSCFVDLNTATTTLRRMDMVCRNCLNRPASMLWMPCRHLCVCMVCERRVKNCPICSAKKTESFKINLPFH